MENGIIATSRRCQAGQTFELKGFFQMKGRSTDLAAFFTWLFAWYILRLVWCLCCFCVVAWAVLKTKRSRRCPGQNRKVGNIGGSL